MGELYGLVVHFDVLPGHEAAFDALVAETIEKIRLNEPDTLVYISHKDALSSPSRRVFYELYRDFAAFEIHEASSYVQRFLAEEGTHLNGDPVVMHLSSVAGVLNAGGSTDA